MARWSGGCSASSARDRDRPLDGVALLREAVTSYEHSFGKGVWHTQNVTWLGEALLLADRLDEAQSVTERALALIREGGHRVCEPWALRLLGEIAARGEDGAPLAERYLQEALAMADELGMRPLVAYCNLGLGKLHRRRGQRQQARDHQSAGAAQCRAMQMHGLLQDTEAD